MRYKIIFGSILNNRRRRIVFAAAASLALNICYALYNGILGFAYGSLWFLVLSAYYIILSVMRFAAVFCERKNNAETAMISEMFVMRFTGIMLMLLSLVLCVSVSYSIFHDVSKANGKIVMITIASYTFYKVIIALVNASKTARHPSPLLRAIRNISCADAAASVFSLQRSMLASFDGMSLSEIRLMNIVTGCFVCLIIFILGLVMAIGILGGKENGKIKNSKSK
ncbi:MAG: hypothetical protein ACI4JX_00450 [Oscillospiraceae bacterium]